MLGRLGWLSITLGIGSAPDLGVVGWSPALSPALGSELSGDPPTYFENAIHEEVSRDL